MVAFHSPKIFWRFLLLLVVVFMVREARAQDPTVGCENCPEGTTCIKDMCYEVIAAPPGMDSKCNDAFCAVENGGKCVNDQCVVLQNGIGLAPSGGSTAATVSPTPTMSSSDGTDSPQSSGMAYSGLTSLISLIVVAVVYVGM